MAIFKCKHKEIRIIDCKKENRYYNVKCAKCGEQWQEPKAEGEEYTVGKTIKRWQRGADII